jgi:hypothetical protein
MTKLRFSVREIFWLILVVALALGWWIDHTVRYHEVVKASERYREEVAARERDLAVLRQVIEQLTWPDDGSVKSHSPAKVATR